MLHSSRADGEGRRGAAGQRGTALRGLVFDLDGTLVDTAPDLMAATNAVLVAEGRRPVGIGEIRAMVGQGARRLIERGFAATGTPLEAERLDLLYARFIEHYMEHIADESQLFPGVAELVLHCRAHGLQLAVCTNKLEAMSVRLMEAMGLAEAFPVVIGPDTLGIAKPDAAPYREACRRLGIDAAASLMIGDSETDVLTARAAGVAVIAVSFGYTDAPVSSFGPDHVVDHFDEVWALIADRLAAAS
jgi:phosphoglycolate phosphatase